jgi:hypothetical protein
MHNVNQFFLKQEEEIRTISEIKTKLVGAGGYLLPRTAPVILINNKQVALNILLHYLIIIP